MEEIMENSYSFSMIVFFELCLVCQGLSPKELRSYEEMNSSGRSKKKKKKAKQEVNCL